MAEKEWVEIATTTTNKIKGSEHVVDINAAPICPNMTNKEFRLLMRKLRDASMPLIDDRISGLARWDAAEQARVQDWFGRKDHIVRDTLKTGLPRLRAVMKELDPEKIIRWDEFGRLVTACVVRPDNGNTDAAVCKPDSHRRMIGIYSHFCTLPDADLYTGCKLKVIIHECTHYVDTFDSDDVVYGQGIGLKYWAQSSPERTINNADSIAMYIAHFDHALTL